VIAADGRVTVSGPVQVGRTRLTRAQLGGLAKLAAAVRFGMLPKSTSCAGTLPDVAGTFVYCAVMTFIILKVIDIIMGLRVSQAVEVEGLDINLHGEVVQ